MNRSLIHRGFYREMLRQLRTKGLVSTFILAGINLIVFAAIAVRDPLTAAMSHVDVRLMALPMLVFLYVMCPIMVFGAYRFLIRRVQSDFYHAIPLSRVQLYASATAAIFTWLFLALFSFAAVFAVLFAIFGLPFNYLLYLCVFVNMLIAAIEIVGAFSLGSALSGTRFVAFFSSVVILFLPRALLAAFAILIEVDTGVSTPFSALPFFLNPAFNIAATPIHSLIYKADFANGWAMLYSFAYACGLLLLGGIAFRRRKSEAADIPYSSKILQTITRATFGLPQLASIVILFNLYVRYGGGEQVGQFFTDTILLPMMVTSVFFSFIFYCLYELISSKKMKSVLKAMPFYGLTVLTALLLIFVPAIIGRNHTPSALNRDSIRSYRFSHESSLTLPSGAGGVETYPNYVLHTYDFTDEAGKSRLKAASTDSDFLPDFTDGDLVLVRDGGLLPRVAEMRDNYNPIYDLSNADPAFVERYYAFPEGQIWYQCEGLSNKEAKEVGRLFREDYEKLTNEQKASLMRTPVYNTNLSCSLMIRLYGCKGTDNYTMSYQLNELTPNATQYYLSVLNDRYGEQTKRALADSAQWLETKTGIGGGTQFLISDIPVYLYDFSGYNSREMKEILKALSEAPLTSDYANGVLIRAENPNYRMNRFYLPPVAIECTPELRAKILAYGETHGVRYDEVIDSAPIIDY